MPEPAAAPVVPPTVFRKGLLLHCGAEAVDRGTLSHVETPSCTESWFPLPHDFLLKEVESQLTAHGFGIGETTHALSHEGKRYFGVLQILRPDDGPGDYSWIVGIRNSHDKTFPASLVMGTRVFVCDNLAFNGEVKLSRKHTRFAVRDLRFMTSRAVGRLGEQFHREDERIAAYKKQRLTDKAAHDLLIRAVDCRAITPTVLPEVIRYWREPLHEEFRSRTVWSLFNAFTEQFKAVNPHVVAKRSQALHGLVRFRLRTDRLSVVKKQERKHLMNPSYSLTGTQAAVLILAQSVSGQTSDELIGSFHSEERGRVRQIIRLLERRGLLIRQTGEDDPFVFPAPGIPPGTVE